MSNLDARKQANRSMLSEEDQGWLELLRTRDEEAMELLFKRYYKYLVVTAYNILEDDARAKDLVQDTFFDIWRKREELQIDVSLKAYLRRAVSNKAIDEIRRSKKMVFDEQLMKREPLPDLLRVGEELEGKELEKLIHSAIEALPEKCRLVFKMSRFEELSHREIAEKLNISTKTIENQITKALKFLRKNLAQYGKVILLMCLEILHKT